MFRDQMRQICQRCKGKGTSNKELLDNDGNVMLAPTYNKRDPERPQFENCKDCAGTGYTMQPAPTEVFVEGAKVKLEEPERRARFNDALA